MKHPTYIIVATDRKNGIGKNGKMPWNISEDMRHFTDITTHTRDSKKQNMVIMGQVTWESLSEKYRPLPNRKNIVLSFDQDYLAPGALVRNSFENALGEADSEIETIFIIGGASVYKYAVENIDLNGIYLTKIGKTYDCDTYFPKIPAYLKRKKILSKGKNHEGIAYTFLLYTK